MTIPAAPLGILGDGQLALMLGEAAFSQGFDFLAFGDNKDSSFARAFPDRFIQGNPKSTHELIDFARKCGTLILENEFFESAALESIENESHTPIIPSPMSYRNFETKLVQRAFYDRLGLKGPKWAQAKETLALTSSQVEKDFGYPLVLKASRGGYDGYGVRVVKNSSDLPQALRELNHTTHNPVLIEEMVLIRKEFAQGALFDGKGGAILLPLVETVQKNGICELVLSRSTLPSGEFALVRSKIERALLALSKSSLVGLFNFEFFYTESNEVLINEGAPRPHNSQHLSIDSCPISQFELLVRFAVTRALPAVASPIEAKPAVMINLLGKSNGTQYALGLPTLPLDIEAYPKLYLKKESRVGRKMGHLNLVDPNGTTDLVSLGFSVQKEYTL